MKAVKANVPTKVEAEDIPEVDFSKGVRGKYYKRYFAPKVTVQLDADVAEQFNDSAAANEGLRELLRRRSDETTKT
jgi:hypothetical protein